MIGSTFTTYDNIMTLYFTSGYSGGSRGGFKMIIESIEAGIIFKYLIIKTQMMLIFPTVLNCAKTFK